MKSDIEQITEMLGATADAMGAELSGAGLAVMAGDLEPYGLQAALSALARVRRECQRLTLAAIIERIETADGRPRSDEAWANALAALDESETVVWTDEAKQAFFVARPLLTELRDQTGARMAFRDAYERLVRDARERAQPVRWSASLGQDAERRAQVLESAVLLGRLEADHARGLLPPPAPEPGRLPAMLALAAQNGKLTRPGTDAFERENAKRRIAELREMLNGGRNAA